MDIYDNPILCRKCNRRMKKITINRDNYELRAWKCPSCKIIQIHPLDEERFNNFKKLKSKHFEVKLRMIGNSFCVSIPKEIIEFEKEIQKRMNNIIKMSLETPEKLSLYFTNKFKKIKEIFEEK